MENERTVDDGDKVSASMSFKKNLGNYQSMDFYAGVSVSVREGESEESAYSRAWDIVDRQLEEQVAKAAEILAKDKR